MGGSKGGEGGGGGGEGGGTSGGGAGLGGGLGGGEGSGGGDGDGDGGGGGGGDGAGDGDGGDGGGERKVHDAAGLRGVVPRTTTRGQRRFFLANSSDLAPLEQLAADGAAHGGVGARAGTLRSSSSTGTSAAQRSRWIFSSNSWCPA